MPRYRLTKRHPAQALPQPFAVTLGSQTWWMGVHQATLEGPGDVPVYLLERDDLYHRDALYGDAHGAFGDNFLRYALLSQAALNMGDYLGWQPDLIHLHDWQASLLPVLASHSQPQLPTVLTIHNLGYQGRFALDDARSVLGDVPGAIEHFGSVNLLAAGVRSATCISTVSPRYAIEIQTPEGGAGLDWELRQRSPDVVGILNGIDTDIWNPATDPHLPAHYDERDLAGKAACKAALQSELGLPQQPDVPLLGVVSRLAHQKGIDVLAEALAELLPMKLQLVVLGSGEAWAERLLTAVAAQNGNLAVCIGYNEPLAHRIEAGADLFLMPSRYEPCGLNQMYSQRYGTVPVVRAVGGLDDTVEHGVTGFKFDALSGAALAAAVREALALYQHGRDRFVAMQRAGMRKNMSWDRSAAQYDALYRLAMHRHPR